MTAVRASRSSGERATSSGLSRRSAWRTDEIPPTRLPPGTTAPTLALCSPESAFAPCCSRAELLVEAVPCSRPIQPAHSRGRATSAEQGNEDGVASPSAGGGRRTRPRMTSTPVRPSPLRARVGSAVLATWFVTAAWDFLCASALSVFAYGSTVSGLWQGVASVALGPAAREMGARGIAAGLALHLLVALTWSAAFVFAVVASRALQRVLARPLGALAVAALYGPSSGS